MKRIFKKASAVCAALICTASLTAAGSTAVFASSEPDETILTQSITIAEGLTTTIIPLTDEDIENYLNSADDFTIQAMESGALRRMNWESLKNWEPQRQSFPIISIR